MPLVHLDYPCKFDASMQSAQVQFAEGSAPRPLLVALHTWSYTWQASCADYAALAAQYNWHLIFPDFRGPNWLPAGCGSDAVVSDLEDAVAFMKERCAVDPARVYLTGGSGGGHCSLLLAGRRPDLWTAVSSWCPISDIALWHAQSLTLGNAYAEHIEKACGGDPETSERARWEARLRSPVTWLANAGNLPIDIGTGIHDGHTGSVPVGQAIRAYNILAAPADRISEEEIGFMERTEQIPAHLQARENDPAFGEHTVLLRRKSRNVRLTLFEGGHNILPAAALQWLDKQISGKTPDWSVGRSTDVSAVELTR